MFNFLNLKPKSEQFTLLDDLRNRALYASARDVDKIPVKVSEYAELLTLPELDFLPMSDRCRLFGKLIEIVNE